MGTKGFLVSKRSMPPGQHFHVLERSPLDLASLALVFRFRLQIELDLALDVTNVGLHLGMLVRVGFLHQRACFWSVWH